MASKSKFDHYLNILIGILLGITGLYMVVAQTALVIGVLPLLLAMLSLVIFHLIYRPQQAKYYRHCERHFRHDEHE